jgi:glycosyltransferase involved in cell wall biosynthesis
MALSAHVRSLEAQPDAYQELRIGAFTRAKNDYSWSRVVQQYDGLIDDVLCKK